MRLWDVLVDPARKIRIGNKLYFGQDDGLVAEVIDNTTSRGRTLRFLYDGPHEEFKHMLFSLGEAPLPREIFTRPSEPEDLDDFFSSGLDEVIEPVKVTALAETLITKTTDEQHKILFNPANNQACLDMLQLLKSKHPVIAVNGILIVADDDTAEIIGKTPKDLYNFCVSRQAICYYNQDNIFILEMAGKLYKGYCMTTRVRRIHAQIREGTFKLSECPDMPQLRYSNMLE